MIQNDPHDQQPHTATLTGIEAEYEQLCRELQPDYARFCKEQPGFRGGYGVYLQIMDAARTVISNRAEIAMIDQEQREIRDYFLHPPICLMSEKERKELLRLFADDANDGEADQDKADEPRSLNAGFIQEFEKRRQLLGENRGTAPTSKKHPSRAETPDDVEANFLVEKYLSTHPNAGIREVSKGTSISQGRVCRLPAWRDVQKKRAAAKPPAKRSERPLTDKMLAARGKDDDPAANLISQEEDEAIWRWVLENAEPLWRAELYRKNAEERALLIEAARELYKREHPEHDE